MSKSVIFNEEGSGAYDYPNIVRHVGLIPGAPTGMLKFLIEKKIVKNGRAAEMFLLYVVCGLIVFAVGLQLVVNYRANPNNAAFQMQLERMKEVNSRFNATQSN